MTEGALVSARGVGHDFVLGDGAVAQVLSNISCIIAADQHIALTGPSGSGKSTLFHILAGLLTPTRGHVEWPALGARRELMPTKIQVAFQSQSLFPPLTVAQNIGLPLVLAGRDEGDTAVALLERFGLGDLADKLPEELSGGQAQRVAVLRALAIRPRLVLADEPTGQLDGPTGATFMTEVLALARECDIALVVATHDPATAERMDVQWRIAHGAFDIPSDAEIRRRNR